MSDLIFFDTTPIIQYELPSDDVLKNFVIDINEVINSFSDIPEDLRQEMIYVCYGWYGYYYTWGRFYSRENSLKNELRKRYRIYTKDLKDFGKLMEKIYAVFKKYAPSQTPCKG